MYSNPKHLNGNKLHIYDASLGFGTEQQGDKRF